MKEVKIDMFYFQPCSIFEFKTMLKVELLTKLILYHFPYCSHLFLLKFLENSMEIEPR